MKSITDPNLVILSIYAIVQSISFILLIKRQSGDIHPPCRGKGTEGIWDVLYSPCQWENEQFININNYHMKGSKRGKGGR